MDRELLKGYIDLIILGIIKIKKNYGYNIVKEIHELSDFNLEVSEGTLYLSLKRLEQKKFLLSSWEDDHSYPKRKYYEITNEGEKYLKEKYNDIIEINNFMKKIIERS